jgi:hypothetical protein
VETIRQQAAGREPQVPVICPMCAQPNTGARFCRHVRWTFDQGGPIEFARFALETSPYVRARGHSARSIGGAWMEEHGEWIVERVMLRFEALDGYVFGELSSLDMLARDIWTEYRPDPLRPQLHRIDPV